MVRKARVVRNDNEEEEKVVSIHQACKQGDLAIVQKIFNKGLTNLSDLDSSGRSPLWHACSNGHVSVAQFIISHIGSSSLLTDRDRIKLLYSAAEKKQWIMVELLLQSGGADINSFTPGDGTILYVAAKQGDISATKFLLENNADPNIGDKCPLFYAAINGSAEMVNMLLDNGAKIDYRAQGKTAMCHAVMNNKIEVVNTLINRHASTELGAPFYLACEEGHLEIVKIMSKKICNFDQLIHKNTPLTLAIANKHLEIIKFLLECGASADYGYSFLRYTLGTASSSVLPPIHLACTLSDPIACDIVGLLVDFGADVNQIYCIYTN